MPQAAHPVSPSPQPVIRSTAGRRALISAIAAALMLVGGLGLLGYRMRTGLENAQESVTHTREVIEQLQALLVQVQSLQGGQRGFLLKRDERFLQSYNDALQRYRGTLDSLRSLMSDNAVQSRELATVEFLIETKVEFTRRTVELGRAGNFDVAINLIRDSDLRSETTEIGAIIATMIAHERELLANRDLALNSEMRLLGGGQLVIALLCAAMMITTVAFQQKAVRQFEAAERRTRERAAWLQAMTEAIHQGICIFDRELKLAAWNDDFIELGEFPERIMKVGTSVEQFFRHVADQMGKSPEETDKYILDRMETISRNTPQTFERVRSDGTIIVVRANPVPGGGFVSTYTNVTQNRRAEQIARRQSLMAGLLRDLAAASNAASSLKELLPEALRLICRATDWEVGLAQIVESSGRGFLSKKQWYLADPDKFGGFKAVTDQIAFTRGEGLAGQVLEHGKIISVPDLQQESAFFHKELVGSVGLNSGLGIPVFDHGQVAVVLIFFSTNQILFDNLVSTTLSGISSQLGRVAERERSQTELKNREIRLSATLNSVVDAFITIDQRGRIDSFNPAAERMLGYSSAEVIGTEFGPLMNEADASQYRNTLRQYVMTGEGGFGGRAMEIEARRKDGTLFPAELTVSEMRLADRRLFIGVLRDISERKRIDMMKTEFVSTVSHELRTPLTSIAGALSLVTGGIVGDVPEKARGLIEIAHRNCGRLVRLVNDILDIEKIGSGKMRFDMRPLDMVPLAEQAIEASRAYAKEFDVEIKFLDAPATALVEGDPDRLMQVFTNLLSNAAKFSPQGGLVRVTLELSGEQLQIGVADNGPGISEEFRNRIFERFSQAHTSDTNRRGGTGLGLAIVKSIVERHSGQIRFETKLGAGTTFFVSLPLTSPTEQVNDGKA